MLDYIKNSKKILGMNSRYLNYIRPNNLKRAIKIADDKLLSKRVLRKNKIPVPKLIAKITSHEELENFEGILIATTNLANNLDSAFERRFLFKIQFQKPNTTIRAKIWKSKLPFLKVKDCNLLADKFDFSGGQIDNILRKVEIQEIILGKKVSLENLMVFCSEETLGNNIMKIGFKN